MAPLDKLKKKNEPQISVALLRMKPMSKEMMMQHDANMSKGKPEDETMSSNKPENDMEEEEPLEARRYFFNSFNVSDNLFPSLVIIRDPLLT